MHWVDMSKDLAKKQEDITSEDPSLLLRWGKIATRIAAISATITGALAALFSSSSVTSGITLTAAGASTLAAAEKLPNPRYIKTKHIPPKVGAKKHAKAILASDILKPEKIGAKKASPAAIKAAALKAATVPKAPTSLARTTASYERKMDF